MSDEEDRYAYMLRFSDLNPKVSEPRIVGPEEAQWRLAGAEASQRMTFDDLAHTVATEPDRTRAAVVKALRDAAQRVNWFGQPDAALQLADDADAIENGAPL